MWVRPILTISAHSPALAPMASCSASTAGMSRSDVLTAAAMYIADGNESFDDWDMLTWSLGWTGVLEPSGVPASWQQRLGITSLTFMLHGVPVRVIQTCSGTMSWCWPARISPQTLTISPWSLSCNRLPAWLALAAAFLRTA